MSLVTTTRSHLSRIALHSISTSVVLPEPTGPPTPTRSGGRRLLRLAMWCSGVAREAGVWAKSVMAVSAKSGTEQARLLGLVAGAGDPEHRREGLHVVILHRQRAFDRRRHPLDQRLQDALAGELAQRHG